MRFLWIFAIALLAVLVWGLEQIAVAPFETGDIYPRYSSLRTDPSGAKALYESLAALPDVTVERLYKDRTTLNPEDAMFVLGVDPVSWSAVKEQTVDEYEKLVRDGGRLIFAFLPVDAAQQSLDPHRPIEERWGLKTSYRKTDSGALSFEIEASHDWTKLEHGAIERKFGKGTIVLVPESLPLSNQGLRDERDAEFIAALAGAATHILFDENHFGVVETGSVTKLMRKYHLEGALAVLAIVAGLFLWRSASSLLPPRRTRARSAVEGRDSMEGLVALLHRGIGEKDLVDACFAEWSKSGKHDERAARVELEIASIDARDPAGAYRAASKILTEKQ